MDPLWGGLLIAALVGALVAARRVVRREKLRRYQLRRSLNRTPDMPTTGGHRSGRAEMHALLDPTSVMDEISKSRPRAGDKRGDATNPGTRVRDTTRSRQEKRRR